MDSIDIQGKKYISSKQAAERSGYAQDYVGQLARSNKVPATRIGRTWYIDEEAILEHAGVRVPQKTAHSTPQSSLGQVMPTQATKTSLKALQQGNAPSQGLKTWSSIAYLEDTADLLPKISKREQEEHQVKINRIASNNIAVSSKATKEISVAQESQSKTSTLMMRPKRLTLPVGALGAASLAFALLGSAFSGVYIPHEWSFTAQGDFTAAAGASEGYGVVFQALLDAFYTGASLLAAFLSILWTSLSEFFNAGINFILSFMTYLG